MTLEEIMGRKTSFGRVLIKALLSLSSLPPLSQRESDTFLVFHIVVSSSRALRQNPERIKHREISFFLLTLEVEVICMSKASIWGDREAAPCGVGS